MIKAFALYLEDLYLDARMWYRGRFGKKSDTEADDDPFIY